MHGYDISIGINEYLGRKNINTIFYTGIPLGVGIVKQLCPLQVILFYGGLPFPGIVKTGDADELDLVFIFS
jgi:hypothetical protein